jgi:hypothetical protein
MTKGIAPAWQQENLPYNKSQDVANAMVICATANRKPGVSNAGRKDHFHGKIIFVGGGNSYEIEDRLQNLEPEWLGKENSRVVELGQQFLHNGTTSWQGST